MVAETEDAIAEASSQLVAYGYYTPVIVMFDTDDKRLREQAEAVRRLIQAEGFGARIETLNATEAYLGSLPGNSYANVREPLINTRNLADLMPVNSVWSGSATAPCPFYPPNAPPLMQVASGSTPFRLNLHVDDVGYTLIFGPTGSGKSTLLALIGAFQTFEVEELMNLGERNLVPVLLYLFRRIEKRLTGAPSLILLDEAWLMLGHATFRDKIREWLKVLRKANCAVILATQSISDAERSGIIDVLKESCPTKIAGTLLPAP